MSTLPERPRNAQLRVLRSELLEAHRELGQLPARPGSDSLKALVAFRRLLESETGESALRCVEEILINLVGSENFVVLLAGRDNEMHVVGGTGDSVAHTRLTAPTLEVLHRSVARVVPLFVADTVVGALAIYELLPHRDPLNQNDDPVLMLLSRYAATIMMAAEHRHILGRAPMAEVA